MDLSHMKVLTQICNGNKKIQIFLKKEKKRKDPIFSWYWERIVYQHTHCVIFWLVFPLHLQL